MKAPAACLFALVALAGCTNPVDESAWTTYKGFATCVHTGQFEQARGMLEHNAPAGWQPRIGGPAAPSRNFSFKSIQLDRKSASANGDTLTLTTGVTMTYADKRNPLEVVFMWVWGGEWFYPDEKLRYIHHATMTRVDGAWKISDVRIEPKG
ncbi:MAG: hypothetical protein K8T20_14785 [Planctomycetes bacterium]|nr:hypothetical protein [Planctomycetota bacterium]